MNFEDDDKIARILANSTMGGADDARRQMLEEWAGKSPANRAVYNDALRGGLTGGLEVDPAREKAAIARKIRRRSIRRTLSWSIPAAAASIALLLMLLPVGRVESVPEGIAPGSRVAILELGDGRQVRLDTLQRPLIEQDGASASLSGQGQLVYLPAEKAQDARITNKLYVPRGGEYRVMLGDGTQVWLNAGSSLEYPLTFDGGERRVRLSGEGYFEVTPNDLMPFIVETGDQVLTVLGTRFNVSAYAEDGVTITTLCEGSVEVEALTGGGQALLVPGQQAQLHNGGAGFTIAAVDAREFTLWKDGVFIFDERGLGQAMQDIARWYDITVDMGDIATHDIVFKGNLPKYEDLDKLLGMIEKIAPARFYMRGGVLHVDMEQ